MALPEDPGGDGSMETILASIRRIIREDEGGTPPQAAVSPGPDDDDELLVLQPSMMVTAITAEEAAVSADAPLAGPSRDATDLAAALFDDVPLPPPVSVAVATPIPVTFPPPAAEPVPEAVLLRPTHALTVPTPSASAPGDEPLLAPQAHAAAAQALAALQEAVRPPPPPADLRLLRSGGPTVEDLVRDELRGQLKLWLDTHLPPMVERLVRGEIERLVRPG